MKPSAEVAFSNPRQALLVTCGKDYFRVALRGTMLMSGLVTADYVLIVTAQ